MGSVCVVKAKRRIVDIINGLKDAGSFILHTKGYASTGKKKKQQRKKYARRSSEQYFETDKLLFQDQINQQPLGLLGPQQINNLLEQQDDYNTQERKTTDYKMKRLTLDSDNIDGGDGVVVVVADEQQQGKKFGGTCNNKKKLAEQEEQEILDIEEELENQEGLNLNNLFPSDSQSPGEKGGSQSNANNKQEQQEIIIKMEEDLDLEIESLNNNNNE